MATRRKPVPGMARRPSKGWCPAAAPRSQTYPLSADDNFGEMQPHVVLHVPGTPEPQPASNPECDEGHVCEGSPATNSAHAHSLAIAASQGNVAEVQRLLAAGVDANCVLAGEQMCPLSCAACHGHPAVVSALLSAGADWKQTDLSGKTALELAQGGAAEAGESASSWQEVIAILGAWAAQAELREEMDRHSFDYSAAITAIFQKHNPLKVDAVPALLDKYAGREEELYNKVRHKYEAPE